MRVTSQTLFDMDNIVISTKKLGKLYRYKNSNPNEDFRDFIVRFVKSCLGKIRRFSIENEVKKSSFWALKDINFTISRGEVVGIVGRNGAGKSTFLKIISRVTSPTEGEVEIRGRVASLLEVGTGFHPDLTGRENIYLNGAILGMKRSEINDKMSDIVKFSGIQDFLETPVKRYSTGMYMRLAFAIAAHVFPDILIIDEVLAVGDSEFQKKCIRHMRDVATSGRTVLFVSHNMGLVSELCTRAILLENGKITKDGKPKEIIDSYFSSNQTHTHSFRHIDHVGAASIGLFESVKISQFDNKTTFNLKYNKPFKVAIIFKTLQEAKTLSVGLRVWSLNSFQVAAIHQEIENVSSGKEYVVIFELTHNRLKPGNYYLDLEAIDPSSQQQCLLSHAIDFVIDSPKNYSNLFGFIDLDFKSNWSTDNAQK